LRTHRPEKATRASFQLRKLAALVVIATATAAAGVRSLHAQQIDSGGPAGEPRIVNFGLPETLVDPIGWSISLPDGGLTAGDRTELRVQAEVPDGWYLYALTQPAGGPQPLRIVLAPGSPVRLHGEITSPRPRIYPDRNFDLFTEVHREDVSFGVPVDVDPAAGGAHSIVVRITFQACNDRYCLPPQTDTVIAITTINNPTRSMAGAASVTSPSPGGEPPRAGTAAQSPELLPESAQRDGFPGAMDLTPRSSSPLDASSSMEDVSGGTLAGLRAAGAGLPADAGPASALVSFGRQRAATAPADLGSAAAFLWLAVLMGLASLLTPCVFPMLPLTVAYFGGRTGGRRGGRFRDAGAFGTGIVLSFTAVGLLVAILFGAGGVVRLAASPWMNLAIAALFGVFALNLLGLFEVRLPTRLLTRAARVGGNGSTTGAALMGSAFAVTSFTCTAPFVGTLLVLATQGSWRWPLLGLGAYAAAFALPFFVLASAPTLLERLPRGGPWLTDVRRSLGILEAAAAVKFLSNADLVLGWGVLTRNVVIGIWAAAVVLVGLLLVARHPRVPSRLAVGALCLALALWMGRGLQGYRLGELEAFLPPPPHGMLLAGPGELPWRLNEFEQSLRIASATQRPLLIDFTGYTCTNCRWMEANMFTRGEVRDLLGEYVRVRLYTDGQAATYAAQQALQAEMFGTVALPFYAVLSSDGRPLATFLGMTREPQEFAGFLRAGLLQND
jgi:thiol:disulfide interchange protein